MPSTSPNAFRFRFSIRSFLILIALFGVAFGVYVAWPSDPFVQNPSLGVFGISEKNGRTLIISRLKQDGFEVVDDVEPTTFTGTYRGSREIRFALFANNVYSNRQRNSIVGCKFTFFPARWESLSTEFGGPPRLPGLDGTMRYWLQDSFRKFETYQPN